MKFTVNWLKKYIDPGVSPEDLAARLTMAGLEVDSVDAMYPHLDDKVRIARVLSVDRHPDADRLTVCLVSVGETEHRVVCGAPNARQGMITAIALPGAVLSPEMVIRKSKIRGQISEGMLCSEKDLGISDEHEGIMDLPENMEPGLSLGLALELRDTLIEVDLTPNRPDCASLIGIAREAGGFSGRKVVPPVTGDLPELTGKRLPFSVEVKDNVACPRYAARMLTGVKIGPSPWWLKRILLAVGLRPINNVVDITNFVMLEYGQPLHAFDFSRLAGGRIIVRMAADGETIDTLDGVQRTLETDMLMICDAEQPVAVAGIMGGEGSQVTGETTDILLESAYFDPVGIRRTVRKLKMGTDSSYRFERGVDPMGIPLALERAARLIRDIAGGTLLENGFDISHGISEPSPITLRIPRLCELLGISMTAAEAAAFLSGIDFKVEEKDPENLLVHPPSFRVDIEREIDLVEEIARLKGYDEIPTTLPVTPMSFPETGKQRQLRKVAAGIMVALGFNEAINYSFVTEKHSDMLALAPDDPARQRVRLMNPLGEEQSVMRTSLIPTLLENTRRNINHQNSDVRLYETGKVFSPGSEPQPDEDERLTAVLTGRRHPGAPVLHFSEDVVDYYDVKGVAQQLLDGLRLYDVAFVNDTDAVPYAEAGAFTSLEADGQRIGMFGQMSRKVLKDFGIKQDLYFIDMSLAALSAIEATPKAFVELPKFPSVRWDIAVLVPESTGGGEMIRAIEDMSEPLVERAEVFDIYRGKGIDPGLKSVALSITYRSREQTLDDETVAGVHNRITDLIISQFKGKLREV